MNNNQLKNGIDKATAPNQNAIAKLLNNSNGNGNGKESRKESLRTWGVKQASKTLGDLSGLRNAMHRIFNSYLSELVGKQNDQTKGIQEQIDETKKSITEVNNEITHLEKHEIPGQQSEIEDFKNEIENTRIESEAGFIGSDFNWVKTILFSLFSVMLGLSLIFFYTSLIYNGLFKDVGEVMRTSDIDSTDSLFSTLLDVKSLFTLNTGIILSYLFSSLFLTMGLLLHTKKDLKSNTQKVGLWLQKIGLLIVALVAEIIFAYKIEKNIDEIKSITLTNHVPAENWTDLLFTVDVAIVITLGFIAYLVWSVALENTFTEWGKRNPKKLAAVKIRELEKKINRRKYKIGDFNKQVSILKGNINTLNEKLDVLKRKLTLVFFQPVELEDRLEAFFSGWLFYINNQDGLKNGVKTHQNYFIEVKETLLRNETINQQLNN
jgi:predicted  nucleic acid-binding Zn-ribbon protein